MLLFCSNSEDSAKLPQDYILSADDAHYLLSEVFSQDSLEAYFSRQRHCGRKCDNPSIDQFLKNTATLVQRREVYRD